MHAVHNTEITPEQVEHGRRLVAAKWLDEPALARLLLATVPNALPVRDYATALDAFAVAIGWVTPGQRGFTARVAVLARMHRYACFYAIPGMCAIAQPHRLICTRLPDAMEPVSIGEMKPVLVLDHPALRLAA